LRETAYPQPDGNYHAGCWLTTNWLDGWVDGEGFSFDDDYCKNCFTNYLCSTNRDRAPTPVPTLTSAVRKVESSLTLTVGAYDFAESNTKHLYVKLWSGTTPIPLLSPTSVPAYTGACDTTYRDDDWSGPSGWLKLDAIDVSTKGTTSSQSLGTIDPTLPLTHIELYNAENDAVQVAGVTIQVGDTYYWLRADWSNAFFDLNNAPYANGDGWLETDQSCVWWTKIYMEEL
jgi:hypothetical protein